MRCEEVEVLIQRHVDHDLSEEEHLSLQQHVTQCSACKELMDRLVYVSNQLDNLPKVDPPYSIVDSILPQLGLDHAEADQTVKALKTEAVTPISTIANNDNDKTSKRKIHQKKRFWIPSSIVAAGLLILLMTQGFTGSGGGLSSDMASEIYDVNLAHIEKDAAGGSSIAGFEEHDGEPEAGIMMGALEDKEVLEGYQDGTSDNARSTLTQFDPASNGNGSYGIQPEFVEGIVSPDQSYIAYLGYRHEDILIDKIDQQSSDQQARGQVPHHLTRKLQWESPWYVKEMVWVEDTQLYVVLIDGESEEEAYWLLTVTERGAEEEQLEEALELK